MGLDMFLYGKKTIYHNENWTEWTEKTKEVAYWRNAHAINGYFCGLKSDGEDSYNGIVVSKKNFEDLLKICNVILNTIKLAGVDITSEESILKSNYVADYGVKALCQNLLCGIGEYDVWYFIKLKITVEQIEPIVNEWGDGKEYSNSDGWKFEYRASW